MSLDLSTAICHLGHVASATQLERIGARRRTLSAAVSSGMIRRIARGTYACAHLSGDLVTAARAGTQLDCVSSLARHEIWSGIEPAGLHLRMRPHHHQRSPLGAVMHWSDQHEASAQPFEVSPIDALLQAIACLPPDDALASVESALHEGFIDEEQFDELYRWAPARLRPMLEQVDRGAQSGFETHTRVKLVRAGFRVRTQFPVPGTSDFDLLVEDCVAIETDGRKWHAERFVPDRTKDIIGESHHIRVLRLAGTHIFDSWPRTLDTIRTMVADAQRPRPRKRRS